MQRVREEMQRVRHESGFYRLRGEGVRPEGGHRWGQA